MQTSNNIKRIKKEGAVKFFLTKLLRVVIMFLAVVLYMTAFIIAFKQVFPFFIEHYRDFSAGQNIVEEIVFRFFISLVFTISLFLYPACLVIGKLYEVINKNIKKFFTGQL